MIEAVVQIDGMETMYVRTGSGRPVLVLAGRDLEAGELGVIGVLLPVLAERFRVFVPAFPESVRAGEGAPADTVASWLSGIIDGLGLERPCIVADSALAGELLRFAATGGDRLRGVALIYARSEESAEIEPVLRCELQDAGTPLLMLPFSDGEKARPYEGPEPEGDHRAGGGPEGPARLEALMTFLSERD